MSLKSVEMQIALPRTHDAGKIQEQLQQRGQLQNEMAATHSEKEEQMKRSGIFRQEQKDIARFHSNQKGKEEKEQKRRDRQEKKHDKENHPYKGTMLDIRG